MENPASPSIFESFEYMDRREDYIRSQRDNDTEFQQFFDSSCEAYKEDPEGFQPQRRPYHGRKTGRKPRSNFANKKYNNNNNSNSNGNGNGNGNQYYAKTYYYKRNAASNNSNAVNPEANPENQPVSLEDQFVVKTSNKKSSDYKSRRKYQPSSEPFHGNEEVNGRRFKENEKENVAEN